MWSVYALILYYFTLSHSLNIGGIPYQGDTLLLEKQQAFVRMKIQERIVHPCGSSAFGYFQVISSEFTDYMR